MKKMMWIDVTRRETIEGAEAAIDGSSRTLYEKTRINNPTQRTKSSKNFEVSIKNKSY